ncbi:TonB-dependent receptor [Iodidimonas sp. SYSU 1G8]|uniref:TonB-dependent receptor n=1 Tax=Iodidimonas sp. SYSU 1G8 TaxID=3133967 RepID=UPI0031FEEE21
MSGIALTAGTAMAQDSKPPDNTIGRRVIEQVVVSTKQGQQDVQSIPVSMTAVTTEQLERTFAQDLRDVTQYAPNVSLEPVGIFQNSASFYIRGQGTADIESATDPKVSIFIDGVYQARVSTALADFLDVSAVQILRGPQGTEFGHNTVAGAVVVEHNKPDPSDASLSGGVLVGQFGRLDVKGIVNVPLVEDKAALRIAAKSTNFDGFWFNSYNNEKRGANERLTLNPSIRFTPNDNLDVVIRGEYSRTRDDTYPGQSHNYCRQSTLQALGPGGGGFGPGAANDLGILAEFLFANVVQGKDALTAAAQADALCGKPIEDVTVKEEYTFYNEEERGNFANNDIWGITGEISYDLPDIGTLTYVGNYRKVSESIRFMIETSSMDLFAGQRDQEHFQTTHELRFASSFSDRFDFVTGLYYFKQEYTMLQQSYGTLFEPNILFGPFSGTTFTSPETNSQGGWTNQINESYAAYAAANWHISSRLTLSAGIRYTHETKDFQHCGVGAGDPTAEFAGDASGCNDVPTWTPDLGLAPYLPPGTNTPRFQLAPAYGFDASGGVEGGCRPVMTGNPADGQIFCNNRLLGSAKWSNFSPRVGLKYEISDDAMVFGTWSRGFRSGGFNGRATSPTTIGPFDPERADNFEVGVKSEWFDNRMQLNINGFWTITHNLQQAYIRPSQGAGGQETVVANIGSVTNKGVELEWSAVPVEGLSLFGSLGYIDTNQKGFCSDGDGFSGTDPNNPPPPPFDFLEQCAEAEQVYNEIGQFLGWLVPTDNSNLVPGPRTSKWTLSFGFAYELPVGNLGSLTFAADGLYRTKQYISSSTAAELDGVTQFNGSFLSHYRGSSLVLNGSVTWREVEDRYRLSFFVKNITNELYNQATTNVGGLFEIRVPNQRRHWGLELTFDL